MAIIFNVGVDYNLFMIFASACKNALCKKHTKCSCEKNKKNEDVKLHMKKVQFFAFFAKLRKEK
jgi:hypothetical protein